MRFAAIVALVFGVSCDAARPVDLSKDVEATQAWADIGKACTPSAPATSVDAALVPPDDGHAAPDAYWAKVAREVPGGFAGLFLVNGAPRIALVDTAQRAAVVARLRADNYNVAPYSLDNAIATPARWNFAQLFDWYAYLNPYASIANGVTMGDKDELRNRIFYGVKDSASIVKLETTLKGLDLPCYLVAVGIRAPATFALRQP